MPTPYTTISQGASHVLRLVQQPYATTLQHFSDRGCDQVALDADELQAVLRALPRAVVLAALDIHECCAACAVCRLCVCSAYPALESETAALTPDDMPIPYALTDPLAASRGGGWWPGMAAPPQEATP